MSPATSLNRLGAAYPTVKLHGALPIPPQSSCIEVVVSQMKDFQEKAPKNLSCSVNGSLGFGLGSVAFGFEGFRFGTVGYWK